MTDERIKEIVNTLKNMNGDDNCEDTFSDIVEKLMRIYNKNNALWLFTQFWSAIPSKYLYNLYKDTLQMVECGNYYKYFFDSDILKKIMEVNKHDTAENPELISLLDDKGYLTIYHGHCKPTLRNSNSWTLDKERAKWFGNRNPLFYNSPDYYVVTGKVKLQDIIAYITDRNESEIVVLQKNVKNNTKEFFAKAKESSLK